jgi:hypothetical protein
MASSAMDAPGSFSHLVENIPSWLTQLDSLSTYTKEKNAEFVAEYARLVKSVRPKRVKSPSVCSIQDSDKSVKLPEVETSEHVDVDPLEAGNRHIYSEVQRKRKQGASMRSGASGPQRFRTKHQAVIYYDAHVQKEFDAMVRDVGIARNNLRKGKNALVSSRGFRLPTLTKRYDNLTSSSAENIRSLSKYRNVGVSPNGSKFNLRTTSPPQDDDEASFMNSDKVLEQVQNLYETAAHQFLRDGDCQKELQSASEKLTQLQTTATAVAATLKAKQKQAAAEAEADAGSNASRSHSISDYGCPSLLTDKSSMDPISLPSVPVKSQLSALSQTLEDMRTKTVVSAPSALAPATQGPIAIEVDDGSDSGSFDEIDISQFRSANRLRMRP